MAGQRCCRCGVWVLRVLRGSPFRALAPASVVKKQPNIQTRTHPCMERPIPKRQSASAETASRPGRASDMTARFWTDPGPVRRPHHAATSLKPPQPAHDDRTPRQDAGRASTASRPAPRPTRRKPRRNLSEQPANPRPAAEGSHAGNAATENRPDRSMPLGRAHHRSPRPPRNAELPAQFRHRSGAVREAFHQQRTNAPPPTRPRLNAATPRSLPRHPRQSQPVTLRTNRLGRRNSRIDRRSLCHARAQFRDRGLAGDPAHFVEEVTRERHARQRRSGFEQAMKRLRDIANLDHRGHGITMETCATHVKRKSHRLLRGSDRQPAPRPDFPA
jgi:hypothetical protein